MHINDLYLEGNVMTLNKLVFDANIPIAFKNANCFHILENLFGKNKLALVMHEANLKECKDLSSKIETLTNFRKISVKDDGLLSKMKEFYEECSRGADDFKKYVSSPQGMHTKDDADYYLIITALSEKPDILVTNDRQVFWFFTKYRNRYYPKLNIRIYTLAHFLRLLNISYKQICTNVEMAQVNVDIYREQELPNLYNNMNRAKCFACGVDSIKYCKRNQELFLDYGNNVIDVVKNGGMVNA